MGIEPTNDGYEPPAFTILAILIVCCWCLSWKCSGLALKTQTVLATRPGVRSLTVLPAATSYKTPLVIITKLNQTLEVVDSFNERIAPQYYTELHPKVAEITKLSNRDLQKGKGFHTVFNSFCDWCGDDFVFLVWGTEDLRILRKNMDLHNIDTSFMPPCFNLQNIFVDQVTHDTKQYALANALAIVGEVPFDSHDALNDARSTALLCTHLDLIRGLNEYKETVENRNGIVESYEFEEPYADIGDALSDDYVVSFECPHCGEIVWGENWIRKTGTNLLSLSQCSDGQEYLISLKFRPIAENKVVVKRLVYALTDELRTDYQQCMEQAAAWSKYVIPAYSF